MTSPLAGIRILEVAEQTFVPAASALLADYGADVIKVEHVERGDAMRGLAATGVAIVPKDIHVLFEHSNRGKRSIGLDLNTPEGVEILYKLAASADVFLTNKLQRVRAKLKIELEDIRKHNPKIIYVRGTGQGERGPDANKGSYDHLSFWNRAGIAMGVARPEWEQIPSSPGPGFGDSIGAMTIAGGIAMALLHRERTGEPTVVDVSLLSAGMWAQGQGIGLSGVIEGPMNMNPATAAMRNPLVVSYKTKDERWLAFSCLQVGQYWPDLCRRIGRPELITDERFTDQPSIIQNGQAAVDILTGVFAERTVAEWRTILDEFTGQWTVVQDTYEVISDPQTIANGYMQPARTATGKDFALVAGPIQFDEQPAPPGRAPEFNEHGDAILTEELGLDWDTIVDLKVKGAVA
jgi:crotonobetainyl-CoA:carnitine CoA-transferase CaiB-like acyl-CoA transferase